MNDDEELMTNNKGDVPAGVEPWKLKTARKGVGDYRITVRGKAAHAGMKELAATGNRPMITIGG